MKVWLAPQAEQDLIAAAKFWAKRASAALGNAFLDEIGRACTLLGENPLSGHPDRLQTRRLVLRRFPFSVVYRVLANEIQVIAVAHHRRKPGYWAG